MQGDPAFRVADSLCGHFRFSRGGQPAALLIAQETPFLPAGGVWDLAAVDDLEAIGRLAEQACCAEPVALVRCQRCEDRPGLGSGPWCGFTGDPARVLESRVEKSIGTGHRCCPKRTGGAEVE